MIIKCYDDFDRLPPKSKGYLVYMYGARADEPHIPKVYVPLPEDEAAYKEGQQIGVLEAQDSEA